LKWKEKLRDEFRQKLELDRKKAKLVFGMTKKLVASSLRRGGVDFSKASGEKAIIKALDRLNVQKGISMWRRFVEIARSIAVEAWTKAR